MTTQYETRQATIMKISINDIFEVDDNGPYLSLCFECISIDALCIIENHVIVHKGVAAKFKRKFPSLSWVKWPKKN